MGSSKPGNACVMCNFFLFFTTAAWSCFFPSHWVGEKMIQINVYQISWPVFLFIASADEPSATSRHRQPGIYRALIYWEVRRAVPLLTCTIRHGFPPHGHRSFDTLFAVANRVFLQHHTRMWMCFGSFEGEGMRSKGLVWPDNCYLLPCFAGECWETGRTCVYQFWWSGGSTRIECWGSPVGFSLRAAGNLSSLT